MEHDFSGNLNTRILNEPETKPQESVPILHKGSNFWKILAVILIIALICGFAGGFYFINDGKFQSNVNTEVNPLFNASVNTNNQYSFNPNTQNSYQNNYTIINNIRVCTSNGTC